jgi:SsrA-binding protein
MAKQASPQQPVAVNRKAYHDYFVEEEYEAGVVLTGSEIKSVRAGRVNLRGSYARVQNDELWLFDAHISPNEQTGQYFQHEPTRPRKLLLHRKEINRLQGKLDQKGLTLVPLDIHFKKREVTATRDAERQLQRVIKERRYDD